MPYRISGIDVDKKMLAAIVSDVEVDGEYQFERQMFGRTPNNCHRSLHGCSSKKSRKWSWNRQRNTGNLCGEQRNGTENRYAKNGKARRGDPARYATESKIKRTGKNVGLTVRNGG
jgi:hypothetical protein